MQGQRWDKRLGEKYFKHNLKVEHEIKLLDQGNGTSFTQSLGCAGQIPINLSASFYIVNKDQKHIRKERQFFFFSL